MVYNYNDEEWNHVVPRDPDWQRAETDYLMDLCQCLDLRFLVIADRYDVRSPHPLPVLLLAVHAGGSNKVEWWKACLSTLCQGPFLRLLVSARPL